MDEIFSVIWVPGPKFFMENVTINLLHKHFKRNVCVVVKYITTLPIILFTHTLSFGK